MSKQQQDQNKDSNSKISRKDLRDVVDVFESDQDERDRVIGLIERAHEIKRTLGVERDKKTGKPQLGDSNYGLLAELADLKDELLMIQESNDLDGLRFGRIGMVGSQVDGRSYLDVQSLLDAGVKPEQIKAGYKQGDSYWQTTLFELK